MINWELISENVIDDGLKYLSFCIFLYFLRLFKKNKEYVWFETDWWLFIFLSPFIASIITSVAWILVSGVSSESESDFDQAPISRDNNLILSTFLTFFVVGIIIQYLRWKMNNSPNKNFKETDKYGL
jgi:hypothetical protein